MKNTTESLYYSRTETDQSIVIVWKPFSTYSTFILLAIALVGSLCSITALALVAFLLLIVNAVVYSVDCKKPKSEINEASRNSSVQVSGNKFSFFAPLTITIMKAGQISEESTYPHDTPKQSSIGKIIKKVLFGFLTAVFLILGLSFFSVMTSGIQQNIYPESIMLLLVLSLVFFLLAYLCFKVLKK